MSISRQLPEPGGSEPARPYIDVGTGGHGADGGIDPCSITRDGAAWLVSAGTYPRSTLARWYQHPTASLVLPCGGAFDVVSTPVTFGRRILDQLWNDGPGSGPVAAHRGRVLLFAAPGTAHRLPSLLRWEWWGAADGGHGCEAPPLLCHGLGDAVTVPPLTPATTEPADRSATLDPGPGAASTPASTWAPAATPTPTPTPAPRWLLAPTTRRPWLPGPDVLLWACARAARAARTEDTAHAERTKRAAHTEGAGRATRSVRVRRTERAPHEEHGGHGEHGEHGEPPSEAACPRPPEPPHPPAGTPVAHPPAVTCATVRAGHLTHAARPAARAPAGVRISIFPGAEGGATISNVSRRR